MKCMFKSFVTLFLVLCMICSVGAADESNMDLLKPYLTQNEAIMLAEKVDSTVRYTVDEEENILFEGEFSQEVSQYENGYRISDVLEAVEAVSECRERRYSVEGIRSLIYRMGGEIHLQVNEDASFILGTVNNGEYSLVVPITGVSADGSYYMADDSDVYDAISWMIAVEDMNDTFYGVMQDKIAPSLCEYLTEFEVVWLARTIQDDLKIWFEDDKITFVADKEISISMYEDGYRLDEVFCAVDDAVDGNTFYTKHGMLKILDSLGYGDAIIEIISDDEGKEFVVVHIVKEQNFRLEAIHSKEQDVILCRAMDFYDCIFDAIVGEEFFYESDK